MPAVTSISTVPDFASQEEHASSIASTPNSFSDIPSVLKHKEVNVSVSFDPSVEGFSNVQGTLYVLTSVLAFMPISGSPGFEIKYPAITLHAISRGESGPWIYCQLDESYGRLPANGDGNEDTEMRELTIVPQLPESVEAIFEALSRCASLHPDPLDQEDDQHDGLADDAFVDESAFETFDGDENDEMNEVGRAALAYLESIIHDPYNLMQDRNELEEEAFLDAEEFTNKPAVSATKSTEE